MQLLGRDGSAALPAHPTESEAALVPAHLYVRLAESNATPCQGLRLLVARAHLLSAEARLRTSVAASVRLAALPAPPSLAEATRYKATSCQLRLRSHWQSTATRLPPKVGLGETPPMQ